MLCPHHHVRLGRVCGFRECNQIATPLAGFSCAACVTNTCAAVTSEFVQCWHACLTFFKTANPPGHNSRGRSYKAAGIFRLVVNLRHRMDLLACSKAGIFTTTILLLSCLDSTRKNVSSEMLTLLTIVKIYVHNTT